MRSLVLAAAATLLAAAPSGAATFTVTTPADSGAGSFRAAVQSANANGGPDDIVLGVDVYAMTVAGAENAALQGDYDVTGPTTVRGAGMGLTILDANDVDRLFEVRPGGSLTLDDLTLVDDDDQGGAVYSDSPGVTVKLERVRVTRMTSFSAVYLDDAAGLQVTDSIFDDNDTAFAGGIYVKSVPTTIAGSTFRGNDVGFGGGGVFVEGDSVVTIAGSRFEDNTSAFGGAALWSQLTSKTTVTDSVLTGNAADFGGGALWVQNDAQTTVARSRITGNSTRPDSFGGGAMWAQNNGRLTVTDSTISGNTAITAVGGGGAVFVHDDADVTFERSTVSGNRMRMASGSPGANPGGGVAFVDGDGDLVLRNATVDGNASDRPGGVVLLDDTAGLDLLHTTVSANTSGGAGGFLANVTSPGAPTDVVARIESSVLAGHSAPACTATAGAGTILSEGRNVEDDSTCGAATATDRRNADPRLGPLQDNGGPTQTRALLAGSPARSWWPRRRRCARCASATSSRCPRPGAASAAAASRSGCGFHAAPASCARGSSSTAGGSRFADPTGCGRSST